MIAVRSKVWGQNLPPPPLQVGDVVLTLGEPRYMMVDLGMPRGYVLLPEKFSFIVLGVPEGGWRSRPAFYVVMTLYGVGKLRVDPFLQNLEILYANGSKDA